MSSPDLQPHDLVETAVEDTVTTASQEAGHWLVSELERQGLAAMWDGQTSRHGKQHPTRKETPAEARAAVHLAALLVQYFSSGAIRWA